MHTTNPCLKSISLPLHFIFIDINDSIRVIMQLMRSSILSVDSLAKRSINGLQLHGEDTLGFLQTIVYHCCLFYRILSWQSCLYSACLVVPSHTQFVIKERASNWFLENEGITSCSESQSLEMCDAKNLVDIVIDYSLIDNVIE